MLTRKVTIMKRKQVDTQDQLEDIIKILQTQSEKLDSMLEKRNKESISDVNPLKERLHQHENVKAESEVTTQKDD